VGLCRAAARHHIGGGVSRYVGAGRTADGSVYPTWWGRSSAHDVVAQRGSAARVSKVHDSFALAAQRVNGMFLPVGDAWLAAWKVNSQQGLYGVDCYHPSQAGTYLAHLRETDRQGRARVADGPSRGRGLNSVAGGAGASTAGGGARGQCVACNCVHAEKIRRCRINRIHRVAAGGRLWRAIESRFFSFCLFCQRTRTSDLEFNSRNKS